MCQSVRSTYFDVSICYRYGPGPDEKTLCQCAEHILFYNFTVQLNFDFGDVSGLFLFLPFMSYDPTEVMRESPSFVSVCEL